MFVETYFPAPYKPLARSLWKLRNGMVHSFTPRGFTVVQGASQKHLQPWDGDATGKTLVLNAEDFYGPMVAAYREYEGDLARSPVLQDRFVDRLKDKRQGGAIGIEMPPA
jgi:hypothetical protein